MEELTLTTPVVVTTGAYKVDELKLEWAAKRITVVLTASAPAVPMTVYYSGDDAQAFMMALNKANLSTKSLHKRIMEKLIADGKIAGTVSGTVD